MCDPGQLPNTPPGASTAAAPSTAEASSAAAAPDAAATSTAAGAPRSASEALGMVMAGFGWLADADLADLPGDIRADCLRQLERARSVQTAAHAAVLSAFDHDACYTDDGQGTSRTWLRWQTQITPGAASGAVGWMRRLRAHPAVAAALRAGTISESWARQICEWTDVLPESARADADVILLAAAANGAELTDLAKLVEQMRATLADPDQDGPDDGFKDRRLRLATTLGGIGKLDGDLSASCASAVQTVLDALGKKHGPEDTRTAGQRRHDALEEAMRRLLASGCLPDRAGQPTQLQLYIGLDELMRRWYGTPAGGSPGKSGTDTAETGTAGTGTAGTGTAGTGTAGTDFGGRLWPRLTPDSGAEPSPDLVPWPVAPPGYECDATIIPVVTGRVDNDLLDKLTAQLKAATPWSQRPAYDPAGAGSPHQDCGSQDGGGRGHAREDQADRDRAYRDAVRDLLLANAVALLSGPGQLASVLRTGALPPPAASISLPLDVGAATDTIPPHLRRAVILRDQHCRGPGCQVPAAGCQIHHLVPRSQGGATKLTGLLLLCPFCHLILIHQWGWTITLNPDGTTTARSPNGRTYHSHSPPVATAA